MQVLKVSLAVWLGCSSALFGASYYVSNSGDDGNVGTAPTVAWSSLAKVNSFSFAPGDVVYFERSSVWRGQLVPHSGNSQGSVTYTAYGDGPTPLILGSVEKNRPGDWSQQAPNLWCSGPFPVDVGNIIFNNGQSCGIKVWSREDVNAPKKFWYDAGHKSILLFTTTNPAESFDDIECALKRHIINQGSKSYVVYDGLHLAYGAAHGIGGGGTHHIIVRNCDLCFIGGGHQHSKKTARGVRHVRYGNGIEFWGGAHDNLVENCRIWDIYDAGLTNQGSGRNQQYNITYRNNVVWNCEYSFEYWNRPETSTTHNIRFENNVCFNAGRGWSHGQPYERGSHLQFFDNSAKTDNFYVRNNIFHKAEAAIIVIAADKWNGLDNLVLDHNRYYQPSDKRLAWWRGAGDANPFFPRDFEAYKKLTGKDAGSRLVTLRSCVLKPARLSLRVGESRQIKAAVVYSDGTSVNATPIVCFLSSASSIVTVTPGGRVRAMRPGAAIVTATVEGRPAEMSVVVQSGNIASGNEKKQP